MTTMIVGKILSSTLARARIVSYAQPQLLNQKQNLTLFLLVCKLTSHHITRNIKYISQDNKIKTSAGRIQKYKNDDNRPLLVLLSWLMSRPRHVMKFVNLYTEQGFDVAVVTLTPWQLMWPTKGSRVVAAELLDFLVQYERNQQILLHGFSVGAYMWGEVMDLIQSDRQKYAHIIDMIVGQVWDSVVDVTELSTGIPRAVFPRNDVLQNMLQKYLQYHLKTFYKQSTQYYIRSSQLFHTNLVHTPALFFISKVDPIGNIVDNMRVHDQWVINGVKTYVKIFDKSPHVGHYYKYPKEYVAELYAFLNKLNLIKNEEKIRAHL
ncbi:transmembrane protein 53-like lethal (2) k09913 [Nomia melanderi]|uniref:transmembrane protein 53-like lethal (2) k09913 n=1 Tax=Nomia melanderi TaxID=2448451 RepID=UPI00130423E1|nr:transmembrane protein 53 [Nomia melanderi]XP_031839904.1 transmembrane protein 53 [Nomia melanderi]XP_031839905.1 transmembrane protein 53 [Nomia melanderi]XP_031839906.1 transmembrane protein 53 [Nomia melanderi]